MKKIVLCFLIVFLCACQSEASLIDAKRKMTTDVLTFSQTEFGFMQEVSVNDIITSDGISVAKIELDTSELGNKKVLVPYNKDGYNYQEEFSYNVVDKEAPFVYLSGSYSLRQGYDREVYRVIPCIDNADKNPKCTVEGEYDINVPGKYNLTYVAEDASGNVTRKDFVLTVTKAYAGSTTPNTGTTSDKNRTLIEDIISKYKTEDTMIGIDVSKYQQKIDWEKVKNAGVEFAMIRIGVQPEFFNTNYKLDPYFKANIEGALKQGIKVGGYFYSYAAKKEEAIGQAKFVIDNIKDYNIEMPIAYDWESFTYLTGKGMNIFDFQNNAQEFIKKLDDNGYKGILYSSKNYLNTFFQPVKTDVWLAHYTTNAAKSNYSGDYSMWQLCSNGKVDGINGDVDIDVYFKK